MASDGIHEVTHLIVARYDALLKENIALKAELAELKAKLKKDEKVTSSRPGSLSQIPLPATKTSSGRRSSPFFQLKLVKTPISVEWYPIPHDFSDAVLSVHYNSADSICSFGTADSRISVFYIDSGKQNISLVNSNEVNIQSIAVYEEHRGAINCIARDPISGLYASASGDGTTHVWSLPEEQLSVNMAPPVFREDRNVAKISSNNSFSEHNGPVLGATWSDGALYTISSTFVSAYDVTRAGKGVAEDLGSNSLCIDASPDFPVAVGLASGEVKLWDPRSEGSPLKIFHAKGSGAIISLKISNSSIVTASADKTIRKVDIRTGAEMSNFEIDHVPTKIDIRGELALVPVEDGRTRIVSTKTGNTAVFDTSPFSYTVSSAVWLEDTTILCASWDGSASVANFSFGS